MVNSDPTIGFDRYFDELNRLSNHTTTNYPPYNIVKEDSENYCIELAIAGFGKKDIEITKERNVLTIEGKVDEDSKDFVHKGLASEKPSKELLHLQTMLKSRVPTW